MLLSAMGIPEAFDDRSALFALPYVAVRLIGPALYAGALTGTGEDRQAMRTYVPTACASPLLVGVGALLCDRAQVWPWCAAWSWTWSASPCRSW